MAVTDAFTRADNADLGTNWTPVTSQAAFALVSNAAKVASGAADAAEYYNASSFATDQYAQVVLTTVSAVTDVGTGTGVMVRASSVAQTFYRAVARAGGTELAKCVANVFTALADETATAWQAGDVIRLEVSSTTLTVKRALAASPTAFSTISALTTTDTDIASGRPGIALSSTSTDNMILDDFGAGDLSVATSTLEWKSPAVQLQNHAVTTIVNMRTTSPLPVPALSTQGAAAVYLPATDVQQPHVGARLHYQRATVPMPVPYLVTTPTRVTNPLDWVTVSPDVIWTDG